MVISFLLACLAALLGVNSSHASRLESSIPAYGALFATRAATIIFLQSHLWVFMAPFIALCTLAPWISLVFTLKIQNLSLARNLASLLILLLLCFGISLSVMQGIIRALFTNRTWEWIRTPKNPDIQNIPDGQQIKYQLPPDHLWIWELVFVLLGLWAIGTTILYGNFTSLFILIPFTISYAFILLFSFPQSRKARA